MCVCSTRRLIQRSLGADEAKGLSQFGAAQNLDMAELVERVRAAVVARAAQLLRKEPDTPVYYMVVDLPCTFFMLRTIGCFPFLHALIWNMELEKTPVSRCMKIHCRTWCWLQHEDCQALLLPYKLFKCQDSPLEQLSFQ